MCAVENLLWDAALAQSAVVTAQGNKEVFVWNILQRLVSMVTIITNTFSFRNNICLVTDLKSLHLLKYLLLLLVASQWHLIQGIYFHRTGRGVGKGWEKGRGIRKQWEKVLFTI